jgi:glutamate 5-kinase
MSSKIEAAKIATHAGADMVIANGAEVSVIYDILKGKRVGTLFLEHRSAGFDIIKHLED